MKRHAAATAPAVSTSVPAPEYLVGKLSFFNVDEDIGKVALERGGAPAWVTGELLRTAGYPRPRANDYVAVSVRIGHRARLNVTEVRPRWISDFADHYHG